MRYAGYYLHTASGLNLTRARAYSAVMGRWINRDPIIERGGINLFSYVYNNPINRTDALGLGTTLKGGVSSGDIPLDPKSPVGGGNTGDFGPDPRPYNPNPPPPCDPKPPKDDPSGPGIWDPSGGPPPPDTLYRGPDGNLYLNGQPFKVPGGSLPGAS